MPRLSRGSERQARLTRDWRFELLRIISMILIVGAHFLSCDNWALRTDPVRSLSWMGSLHSACISLGQVGVCLFVLISAYFMARSASSPTTRFVKVWLQLFVYSALLMLAYALLDARAFLPERFSGYLHGAGSPISRNALISLFPFLGLNYWFASAYLVVILVSPFLVKAFVAFGPLESRRLLGFLLFVTFAWKCINPSVQYFNDVAYLASVFLLGVYIRLFADDVIVSTRRLIASCALCFLACAVGTHAIGNASVGLLAEMKYPGNLLTAGPGAVPILSLIMAASIFIWMKGMRCTDEMASGGIARLICRLSPYMFGIYLLHENMFFKPMLWGIVFRLAEPQGILMKFLFAACVIAAVFICCLGVAAVISIFALNPLARVTAPLREKLCHWADGALYGQ